MSRRLPIIFIVLIPLITWNWIEAYSIAIASLPSHSEATDYLYVAPVPNARLSVQLVDTIDNLTYAGEIQVHQLLLPISLGAGMLHVRSVD